MNKGYHRKKNPKVIALFIEIVIFLIGFTISSIYFYIFKKQMNNVVIILFCIWIFVFILTLSLIRYDRIREIRSEGHYTNKDEKKVFLNIYDDKTSLVCHDLKDENHQDEE